MKFRAVILQSGKTATGIVVPPEVVESLGAGKKPKVVVTLNAFTYRSSIAVMGGDFMVPVSAEIREKAKVKGGDEVDVELSVDTEIREVELPTDFAEALTKNPEAKAKFEALSYSKKRGYVMPIEALKGEDARKRRIEKTIAELAS